MSMLRWRRHQLWINNNLDMKGSKGQKVIVEKRRINGFKAEIQMQINAQQIESDTNERREREIEAIFHLDFGSGKRVFFFFFSKLGIFTSTVKKNHLSSRQ